jgi:cytochrome P450 family 709
MLMSIIKSRLATKDADGCGNDLLGLMLEACAPTLSMGESAPALSMDEIIDECKTIFFVGHDTTSHLLPTGDTLNKLRLVKMFLLETLWLYGPVLLINRKVSSDLDFDGFRVLQGTILTIPIVTIHHDKEVWGEDAGEFRPERFENGVTKAAKHPNALLSFSSGPRSCIGQNIVMVAAKAVIAMMLQRFSLELSPKYVHAPTDVLTLRPRDGLPMILKTL